MRAPWVQTFCLFLVACPAKELVEPQQPAAAQCPKRWPLYVPNVCPEGSSPIADPPIGAVIYEEGDQVLRADFDGCGPRRLTPCPEDGGYASRWPMSVSADGSWFAFYEHRSSDPRGHIIVRRSDGTGNGVVLGNGFIEPEDAFFLGGDLPSLVYGTDSTSSRQLWLASLPGGATTPISPPLARLWAQAPDGSVLVYTSTERQFTPAVQTVVWRLEIPSSTVSELGRLPQGHFVSSAVTTNDGQWAAFAWASYTSSVAGGWAALDPRGTRVFGERPIGRLLRPGAGTDLIAVGSVAIVTLQLPEIRPRTIYQAPAGHYLSGPLTVPGTRRLLFTQRQSPQLTEPNPTGDQLLEVDLDSGSVRTLGESEGFHVAEFVSGDGRLLLESVSSRYWLSFADTSPTLESERVETLVRDRVTGRAHSLSTSARARPLGFSADSRAAVLAEPLFAEGDPAQSYSRPYRISAYLFDEDRWVNVADLSVGVVDGYAERWHLLLAPPSHGEGEHDSGFIIGL